MRHTRFLAVLAAATTIALALPAGASTEPVVFEGSGWGHGVGMSQYGSRAMAGEGYSAGEIIEHYYTDSTIASFTSKAPSWVVTSTAPLWVHQYTGSGQLDVKSTASSGLYVCQQEPKSVGTLSMRNNGGSYSAYVELLERRLSEEGFSPGAVDGWFDGTTDAAVKAFQTARNLEADGLVGKDTKNALWEWDGVDRCVVKTPLTTSVVEVKRVGADCTVTGAAAPGDCTGSVRGLSASSRVVLPQKEVGRRNYTEGIRSLELGHGTLRIRPGTGSSVHAVAQLGVDDYVLGIHETILAWGTPSAGTIEALYAQAIASRSYGLGRALEVGPESSFGSDRRSSCWCQLLSSSSSQVYWGWYAESMFNAMWRSVATATAGQIITHPKYPIVTAYFSSSSGGKTESNVWAGWSSVQIPYLQSVEDHWSVMPGNPNASWTLAVPPSTVAQKLGFQELTGVAVVERNPSGTAQTVRFAGVKDGTPAISDRTGEWVRSTFALRSRYFDVSWGAVGDPPPTGGTQPAPEYPFADIADNRFVDDIAWLHNRGLTRGCNPPANDQYCPDAVVNRGEMAVFLDRAIQLPQATADYFDDDNGKFYEEAANRLYEAGITSGCGPRRFCGGDSIPREQMAAFLARALGLGAAPQDFFVDDSKSLFQEEINRIAHADVTRGCNPPTNDRFCPKESVTRGQLAAFLKRALD